MAGTVVADKWQNGDGTENYKCRAWVNFNGTGTVAIRASGNVSSITDNGAGYYTVNFSTSIVDANYCVLATSDKQGSTGYYPKVVNTIASNIPTTSSCPIAVDYTGGTSNEDHPYMYIAIFR